MPVLRTRDPSGGALRGVNLRTRLTGSKLSTYLPPADIWDSLVHYWPMDETGAGTRADAVGSADMTVGGTGADIAETVGVRSYATQTSAAKYLVVSGIPVGDQLTIAAWLKPTESGISYVSDGGAPGVSNGPRIHLENTSTSPDIIVEMWDPVSGDDFRASYNGPAGDVQNQFILVLLRYAQSTKTAVLRFYGMPAANGSDVPFVAGSGPWANNYTTIGLSPGYAASTPCNSISDEWMMFNRWLNNSECDYLGQGHLPYD